MCLVTFASVDQPCHDEGDWCPDMDIARPEGLCMSIRRESVGNLSGHGCNNVMHSRDLLTARQEAAKTFRLERVLGRSRWKHENGGQASLTLLVICG